MKCSFQDLHYFHRDYKPKPVTKRLSVVGFDSEAFDTGEPFLYCTPDDAIPAAEFLDSIFARKYRHTKFVVYNLKYEEGAILYHFPQAVKDEIRTTGKGEWREMGIKVRSIPRKELVLSKNKNAIAFYDISQFFASSLDAASEKYLGERKTEMETKTFTPEYVKKHYIGIVDYCRRDADLTQRLAEYFIDVLIDEFDIWPTKLYSTGYISGIHFSRKCDVIDVNRFWNFYPELLRLAYESYAGGKFEVYQRGFGYFYQYDINSAYPYEIMNLEDVRNAKVIHSTEYQKDATYGFLDCDLIIAEDFSPVPMKNENGVNCYPVGAFRRVITKAEYDYLIAHNADIEILDGYWLITEGEKPFRDEVQRLFELKAQFKGKDEMRYLLVKILLNSFYGKMIQVTEKYRKGRKFYEAGYLFNPIYAAVITANTRLKCCEAANLHPTAIVSCHTDSITTTVAMDQFGLPISKELGDWSFEGEGPGVVVGSGVYQVGDKSHYRGYKGIDNLADLIMQNKGRINIPIEQTLVLSWRLVVFRNADPELVNRFIKESKVLNLHFDQKRNWANKWKWNGQLTQSEPLFLAERA